MGSTAFRGPGLWILTTLLLVAVLVSACSDNNDITTPALPTVTIVATDFLAAESPLDTGTLTVTSSSAAPTGGLVVLFAVSGTATSGADYVSIGTSVTIPAGATTATITVTPIDDAIVEPAPPETVFVALTAGTGYTVGTPSTATVSITSNE